MLYQKFFFRIKQIFFYRMGLCLSSSRDERLAEDLDQDDRKTAESIDINFESLMDSKSPRKKSQRVKLDDFTLLKVLGRGTFGKVLLVQKQQNKKYYAMKVLKKDMIEKKNVNLYTKNERILLAILDHPFIVKLHYAFQTDTKVYLIIDFVIGGELFFHLKRQIRFTETRTRFYAAELILALEYLHKQGIVYRDLKPENILLDQEGHIKVTDFGLSRIHLPPGEKTNTFCGTPEYLAPEILLMKGHDQSADWWSLGALIYEMLTGAPPFYSKDKNEMFRNRLEQPIPIKNWLSKDAADLVTLLLRNDPNERLGYNGSCEIKQHRFFKDVVWDEMILKKSEPPYKPKVFNSLDLHQQIEDTPALDVGASNYKNFSFEKLTPSIKSKNTDFQDSKT